MKPDLKNIEPIAILHSPFKEKFGIPRQANLLKSTTAIVELLPPYNTEEWLKGLTDFSDIWLIFGFHQSEQDVCKPLVRPPRLGGNKKIGVFASRSPFRPNGIGMSRVVLQDIIIQQNKCSLKVSCPDLVDGTPIYDIKPYIHYADANPNARCGYAEEAPSAVLEVLFDQKAECFLDSVHAIKYVNLREAITEILALDPRPAYKKDTESKQYGLQLFDLNIIWQYSEGKAKILSIKPIQAEQAVSPLRS